MATTSYPGVYIEEVPSDVRSIGGVPTSIVAFIGYTLRGPTNQATRINSFAEFERKFGGLDLNSHLSYAVSHFFLNGGGDAYIVRVAAGAEAAGISLLNREGGDVVLKARARNSGNWGNGLRLVVDYLTANPASLFNLTVSEFQLSGDRPVPVRTETFRNLSMDSHASAYAVDAVNAGSNLVELERPEGLAFGEAGSAVSGPIREADVGGLGDQARRIAVALDGGRETEVDLFPAGDNIAGNNFAERMEDLARRIEAAVRGIDPGNPVFAEFEVKAATVDDTSRLTATSGTPAADREHSQVSFGNAGQRNAARLLRLGTSNGGRESSSAASVRPATSGTVLHIADVDFSTLAVPATLDIDIRDGNTSLVATKVLLWNDADARPADAAGLVRRIEGALATATRPELRRAQVAVVDSQLVLRHGGDDPNVRLVVTGGPEFPGPNAGDPAVPLLGGGAQNVGSYQLGGGRDQGAQQDAIPGSDGSLPAASDFVGSAALRTGLHALDPVDLFNILVLPNMSDPAVLAGAIAYAERRRAFVVVDLPDTIDTTEKATAWLEAQGGLRHRNAGAYIPRLRAADPLQQNRIRSFANSGAIAGVYARTDSTRGVWKAPAGTDATLRGVQALSYAMTDAQNGVINPLGLNALRSFPAYGPISWGARTLMGSDAAASEWKYVPVRRLALFLEESLYRGTQWVVFEPNDEPLWAQIRLNVGAFMHTLFRQGAFQGKTPSEAYLVQCDHTTTTHDDINLGIVNIKVGFAPLKPAEFVILRLQQLVGQAGAGA